MFEHGYTETILINATPADVWRVLSDLSRLPEWYYPSRRVQLMDSNVAREGAQFVLWIRTAAGVEVRAPGEVLHVETERMLQWRGRSTGIAATATWTLVPRGDQTQLTHEFAGGGWMMLLSTITGRAPRTARTRLANLKRVVETS
ncbi:MAG: SRPBCC family protein [Chloroflexi bacterium]|nr:SRPBCC family protein [Chloroflexota bacterium]